MPDYVAPGNRYGPTASPGNAARDAAARTPGKRTLVEGIPAATAAGASKTASPAPEQTAPTDGDGDAILRSGPAGAPPDLGNYDSAVGKQVLVLRGWDNTTIAARRVELQGRLSRTTDIKARDELLREYEAIEWVARERNIALPKDPGEEAAPQAFAGGKPIKFWVPDNAQGMRAMLEREMAAGSGYDAAREHAGARIGYSTTSGSEVDRDKRIIGDQQTELMDHDAAAFRSSFRNEARQTALSMLDASTVAVDAALRSYGIAGGSFRITDAAHRVAKDPGSLDAEVDKWVTLSSRLDGNRAAFASEEVRREELAREAERLRALQESIAALAAEQLRLMKLIGADCQPRSPAGLKPPAAHQLENIVGQNRAQPMQGSAPNPFAPTPKPPAAPPEQQLAFVQSGLQARQAQFKAAWIQAEREHPVLAAYRGGKAPDASALTGIGGDESTTRSIVKHVLPKLGNIYRTKAALQGAWGDLDPLQLAPVVELTKQRMFVAEGSYRDRAVHDMADQAHEKHGFIQWAFEAVLLGLTLVTLVPTGGTSAMAALALTGLAYDIYAGLGEYEDFKLTSAAADTDLDKMRSLSDAEPSLTPLLMRMISAGLNVTMAGTLFKGAAALRRAAMTGAMDAEAVAALNKAGEAAGVKDIGDEAVASARSGTKTATPAHGEKPAAPSADVADQSPGHAPRDEASGPTRHASAANTANTTARDARVRITHERLEDMTRRLNVRVQIDETGRLRGGIELHYATEARGNIRPTFLRVGPDALVDDVLAHGNVIGRITRYNGALGDLRKLWDRLVALLTRGQKPLKPGTVAWESYQELSKLDDLIALRQSARMGHGAVSPEILDHEVDFFEGYRAHHEAIVADAEKAGALGKPAGHIDSPGGWRGALSGEDPSVGGMHEIDPLGGEPHQARLPVAKDVDRATPPERANSGFWEDDHARGNTPWHSDNRRVNEITGYKPVVFKDGYPVLDEYTQETVYLRTMIGDDRDFAACDRELAKRFGQLKRDGTPNQEWGYRYRQRNRLTWHHHQDGARMQLVPTDLHSNIPHAGGASAARAAPEMSTEGAAHE